MKAVYGNKLYIINRTLENGIELIEVDGPHHEIFYVGYNDPTLIVDPTDSEVLEAQEVGAHG